MNETKYDEFLLMAAMCRRLAATISVMLQADNGLYDREGIMIDARQTAAILQKTLAGILDRHDVSPQQLVMAEIQAGYIAKDGSLTD